MRRLQARVVDLTLAADDYRLRDGQEVGAPTITAADEVVWEQWLGGRSPAGWASVAGERWIWRARLAAIGGSYVTDDLADAQRTVRTPNLRAAGVRAWLAVELFAAEPDGTSVSYRLWDGAAAWFWDGAGWELAAADDEWSTAQEIEEHVGTFPTTARRLAVIALLSTTDPQETPSFFGARLCYGCREIGDSDDAIVRTVLAALRADVSMPSVIEFVTTESTESVDVAGERGLVVASVDAAFDLTADPDEESDLPGDLADGVWTPDVPLAVSRRVRIEVSLQPLIALRRSDEVEAVARLPAVLVSPAGAPRRYVAADEVLVRRRWASPPTAVAVGRSSSWEQDLEIRCIAELVADVERLARAVRSWLRFGGYRRLVSPESGAIVAVREVVPYSLYAPSLSGALPEARIAWRLTATAVGGETAASRSLARTGGFTADLEE